LWIGRSSVLCLAGGVAAGNLFFQAMNKMRCVAISERFRKMVDSRSQSREFAVMEDAWPR
jgi:hypothetical protein